MFVNIKTVTNRDLLIEVNDNAKVINLKEHIEAKEGIPVSQQRLIFSGRQLVDENFLKDYNIINESVVHMVLALRAG